MMKRYKLAVLSSFDPGSQRNRANCGLSVSSLGCVLAAAEPALAQQWLPDLAKLWMCGSSQICTDPRQI